MSEDARLMQIAARQIEADLQRWHELLRPAHPDVVFSGIPVLSSQPESKLIALPWECPYCGNVNPGDCLKCWDGVNGCGASRPAEYNEPPKDILHLRELGSFHVVDDPSTPVDFYTDY